MELTTKEQQRFNELLKRRPNGKVIHKPLLGFGEAVIFVDEDNNFVRDITDYNSKIDEFKIMEIKEQLMYIVDNVQFTDKDEAIKFLDKYNKVDEILSILEPRTKDVDNHKKIIIHDTDKLKKCLKEILELSKDVITFNFTTDDFFNKVEQDFINTPNSSGKYIMSFVNCIQGYNDAKFLWTPIWRFRCTSFTSGYEYSQPSYVYNEKEAFENITTK